MIIALFTVSSPLTATPLTTLPQTPPRCSHSPPRSSHHPMATPFILTLPATSSFAVSRADCATPQSRDL
ncbi:unnamed protein product [Cutaneotrichosporon oleaginosum]